MTACEKAPSDVQGLKALINTETPDEKASEIGHTQRGHDKHYLPAHKVVTMVNITS